ncbi:hypothetical protein AB0M29_36615 [Streptomyces sp. NPDC051976]|uniref:hypothetical protein n=1 Tax=Streptomyces sp. NPDC051976 TaxID=3154947 RepID=UPI00343360C6
MLADFREHLAPGDRADHLLNLALARFRGTGLVRERTTQRTDSTRVLAAVRDHAGATWQSPAQTGLRCFCDGLPPGRHTIATLKSS